MTLPPASASSASPKASPSRGDFARNVLKLAGGATTAQVITLLASPIISRLFTPDVVGVENVFISLVGILSVIVCLRYEYAIVLPERDEDAAHVTAASLVVAALMSGLSAGALAVAGQPLLRLLRVPELTGYLWLIPLALLIQGLFRAMSYWSTRYRRFERLSIAQIAASFTTSSIQVSTGLLGQATVGSLIGSWMAGTTIYTGVLTQQTLKDSWSLLRDGFRRAPMLAALKRYRKFALIDTWGGFVNTLSWQLPTLMLSSFFSAEIVGYYGLANRIVTLPLTLIGNAIGQVFFQKAAESREKPTELIRTMQTIFRFLVAVGLMPALVLTITGKELFAVVFGSNWAEAGIYVQILGLWMFFLFISSPLAMILSVFERQEITLVTQLAVLLTRIIALVIGGLTHNIYIVLGIWSVSGVVVYGVLTLWNMRVAQVPLSSVGRILTRYAARAIPFAGVLLILKVGFHPQPWMLTVLTVVVTVAYYLFLLWRENELYHSIVSFKSTRAQ